MGGRSWNRSLCSRSRTSWRWGTERARAAGGLTDRLEGSPDEALCTRRYKDALGSPRASHRGQNGRILTVLLDQVHQGFSTLSGVSIGLPNRAATFF